MDVSAKGLRVLVTAGGAGIGRAIAQTFLQHGARVQVCDVDEKALASLPKEIFHLKADVANLSDVDKLFEETKKNLGGLDVLVNNAGISGPTAKVEDIRPEDWDRCIAVDLNGMFYCTRKAMPMIKGAGGGSIINLSSAAGRLAFPMRTPYSRQLHPARRGRGRPHRPGDRRQGAALRHFVRRREGENARGRQHAHHRQRAGHREHRAVPRDRGREAYFRSGDLRLRWHQVFGLIFLFSHK